MIYFCFLSTVRSLSSEADHRGRAFWQLSAQRSAPVNKLQCGRQHAWACVCPSISLGGASPSLLVSLLTQEGPALISLFQGCGTRDPRPAASNTEESQSRSTSQSVRRGSAGPLPHAYMNPLTDGHGMPVSLPGFMPGPLVTPQSFRESACKAPGPFKGKAALSAQVNTPSNVFMVCGFFLFFKKIQLIINVFVNQTTLAMYYIHTSKKAKPSMFV